MTLNDKVTLAAALSLAVLVTAAAATPPAKLLVASSPAEDSVTIEPVTQITLQFAKPVELLSLEIYGAQGGVITAFEKDYASKAPVKRQQRFSVPLPAPLTAPGSYQLSYLVTSKSVPSLNGFIDFRIEDGDAGPGSKPDN